MTKQERIDILERLEMLNVLDNKIDTIISMLSDKNNTEPSITFSKANSNVDDSELKSYEMAIYSMLDKK